MSAEPTTKKGWLVRHIRDVEPVPCPCGESIRPITIADTPVANVHVTHITDSAKHYHKQCTEFYYILEGRGRMELNEEEIELVPGTVVMIEPGVAHRAYGDIRTMVIGVPACRHDDEFFVDTGERAE